jgi:hypothetical protein
MFIQALSVAHAADNGGLLSALPNKKDLHKEHALDFDFNKSFRIDRRLSLCYRQ